MDVEQLETGGHMRVYVKDFCNCILADPVGYDGELVLKRLAKEDSSDYETEKESSHSSPMGTDAEEQDDADKESSYSSSMGTEGEEQEDDSILIVSSDESVAIDVEQADLVNVKNHLKSLAKGGNEGPLDKYESLRGHKEKHNFVKDLSLDFNGGFAKATEERTGEKEVELIGEEGWVYKWGVAKAFGLPYTKENMPIIDAHCEELEQGEADNEKLKKQGHKMYYLVESKKKTTNRAKKTLKLHKKHELKTKEAYDEAYDSFKDAGIMSLDDKKAPRKKKPTRPARVNLAKKDSNLLTDNERKILWFDNMKKIRVALTKEVEAGKQFTASLKKGDMFAPKFIKTIEQETAALENAVAFLDTKKGEAYAMTGTAPFKKGSKLEKAYEEACATLKYWKDTRVPQLRAQLGKGHSSGSDGKA